MKFEIFMNANRTLWNLDYFKMTEIFQKMDMDDANSQWEKFCDNPHRYIAHCGDETAIQIWNLMCERDRRLQKTTFEEYAKSFDLSHLVQGDGA